MTFTFSELGSSADANHCTFCQTHNTGLEIKPEKIDITTVKLRANAGKITPLPMSCEERRVEVGTSWDV